MQSIMDSQFWTRVSSYVSWRESCIWNNHTACSGRHSGRRTGRHYRLRIELGLPVTLKELACEDRREAYGSWVLAACAENDTLHNMPFEVTPETVCAAIKAADAYGRYFLGE